ncbi:Na-translocating system protein MpsC family protein [Fictibacillus fluitans]|uniref:Na-translocating system protein MpsC family protein n=1 Tax=Fictibacillus fluitans TaxID=3058422 RepID=A0ABT8I2W7_9BACL|nr:Na-translocating system protein MpsC family protein [Fictibacillus sp. NE201]MDN4526832.1 Na-translocating system protein MpsC family protein [Fictibacillus sp. NE201]
MSIEVQISSYMGKLLRDNFGKGPESAFVTIEHPFIFIHIRNFISPMESALLKQGKESTVEETRETMLSGLLPEIQAYIMALTGTEYEKFFYDWNTANQSMMITGVVNKEEMLQFDYPYSKKDEVEKKINEISHMVQKTPEQTVTGMVNDRILVCLRDGILVTIEKELIQKGYAKPLKVTKRTLEKKFFINDGIDPILGKKLTDVFCDWDFDTDTGFLVFYFSPR